MGTNVLSKEAFGTFPTHTNAAPSHSDGPAAPEFCSAAPEFSHRKTGEGYPHLSELR